MLGITRTLNASTEKARRPILKGISIHKSKTNENAIEKKTELEQKDKNTAYDSKFGATLTLFKNGRYCRFYV